MSDCTAIIVKYKDDNKKIIMKDCFVQNPTMYGMMHVMVGNAVIMVAHRPSSWVTYARARIGTATAHSPLQHAIASSTGRQAGHARPSMERKRN